VQERLLAWRRTSIGVRGALLYLLPSPLAPTALIALAQGDFNAAMAAAGCLLSLFAGAHLNRRGIREELIGPARRYTRPVRIPYKYLAAALVGLGTAVAAFALVGQGLAVSLTFGLLALAGYHLTYRLPPLRRLLPQTRYETADKALRRVLEQAERRLLAIEVVADKVANQELSERLRRITEHGRAILDLIAERPAERFRARKFLNVYLEGAERVATRYAKTHRLARTQVLEQNFRRVLAQIEAVFERERSQLHEHDVLDLDIQIEVLRKQLEREGIS
jgi:5-bromo-4-chloroindolyl phosphate hydrolysis protein